MPDVSAGQSVTAQAQEIGADVLARLDELTQQVQERKDVEPANLLEQRKKYALDAIERMKTIVENFIAATNAQNAAVQQERSAADLAEIEKLRASITQ